MREYILFYTNHVLDIASLMPTDPEPKSDPSAEEIVEEDEGEESDVYEVEVRPHAVLGSDTHPAL